jgi:hypothetical protein
MSDKLKEVIKYSNPYTVYKKMKEYSIDGELFLSSRKNKKYMIYDPLKKKMVHFGQIPYEDYTKTNDKDKRERFKKRNEKWAKNDKYSAGYLAYHLLW